MEKGCETAYIYQIRRAQKFIYVENQYFLGSSTHWAIFDDKKNNIPCKHRIPYELVMKIVSKIRLGERFTVYVTVPMYSEGEAQVCWQCPLCTCPSPVAYAPCNMPFALRPVPAVCTAALCHAPCGMLYALGHASCHLCPLPLPRAPCRMAPCRCSAPWPMLHAPRPLPVHTRSLCHAIGPSSPSCAHAWDLRPRGRKFEPWEGRYRTKSGVEPAHQ